MARITSKKTTTVEVKEVIVEGSANEILVIMDRLGRPQARKIRPENKSNYTRHDISQLPTKKAEKFKNRGFNEFYTKKEKIVIIDSVGGIQRRSIASENKSNYIEYDISRLVTKRPEKFKNRGFDKVYVKIKNSKAILPYLLEGRNHLDLDIDDYTQSPLYSLFDEEDSSNQNVSDITEKYPENSELETVETDLFSIIDEINPSFDTDMNLQEVFMNLQEVFKIIENKKSTDPEYMEKIKKEAWNRSVEFGELLKAYRDSKEFIEQYDGDSSEAVISTYIQHSLLRGLYLGGSRHINKLNKWLEYIEKEDKNEVAEIIRNNYYDLHDVFNIYETKKVMSYIEETIKTSPDIDAQLILNGLNYEHISIHVIEAMQKKISEMDPTKQHKISEIYRESEEINPRGVYVGDELVKVYIDLIRGESPERGDRERRREKRVTEGGGNGDNNTGNEGNSPPKYNNQFEETLGKIAEDSDYIPGGMGTWTNGLRLLLGQIKPKAIRQRVDMLEILDDISKYDLDQLREAKTYLSDKDNREMIMTNTLYLSNNPQVPDDYQAYLDAKIQFAEIENTVNSSLKTKEKEAGIYRSPVQKLFGRIFNR